MKEEGGRFSYSEGRKCLLSLAHKSFSEVKRKNTFRGEYFQQATHNASDIQLLGRMLFIYTMMEGDN